ncbi:hypothetical protein MtrunA17_Chr8g0390021 [Medicago truncatula]|uniref:Transmembrane protein n=1 Tax=Medicago truncatula TaxID=3880 RepID=A0A396GSW8_MEDTR|nr:hypothetical protein MtrunA17_Chr8g0390021 [Medicago truncatula]
MAIEELLGAANRMLNLCGVYLYTFGTGVVPICLQNYRYLNQEYPIRNWKS